MAKISFLWHLHQPLYRTADGQVHAPWVLLHAAGEYLTLVHVLRTSGFHGQVLNLTPVFLEQLAAYRDGRASDPLLIALRSPARDLDLAGQRELIRWAAHTNPGQRQRFPRLGELVARVAGATDAELPRRLTLQDLTDLQSLLVLAYAAPNLPFEPELREVADKPRKSWSDTARAAVVEWLEGCPKRLLEGYLQLSRQDGVEIATSPWAHPIVPLLLGTDVVHASWAPYPAPRVPAFAAPEDADEQLRAGLETATSFGFSTVGCWPPEGAVSEQAVDLYGRHGVRWLCTDEGILAASLGHPLTGETGVGKELFVPWRLPAGGPMLFFRHRGLSDFIGFQASRYPDEGQAAADLAGSLRRLAHDLPAERGIVIALDGENPWTSFPQGGAQFLAALAHELEGSAETKLVTLAQRAREEEPARLASLHPGSWIFGTFGTWIGHPEKNRAWELLSRTRSLGAWRGGTSWLAAEGSDWWWWFGDDNPTPLAALYDELFRAHLRDACEAVAVTPPAELAAPVRSAAIRIRVPLSRSWPKPKLDGKVTTFFEWAVAAWMEAPPSHHHLARAGLRGDGESLWLRVDFRPGSGPPPAVVVTVVGDAGRSSYALPEDMPTAVAKTCLEARVPLPAGEVLLAIEHRGERLPAEGFWRLDLQEVDEP